MSGVHHPRSAVECDAEVVPVPQFGLARRQAHPHREFQCTLRSHRGTDSRPRRGEGCAHTVAGVLEQPATVRLDRRAQHLIVGGQRRPHTVGVGLPPTSRPLDVGEQKRHNPRRRVPGGHPHRMSHQTRCYLEHRLIRPGHQLHARSENFRRAAVVICFRTIRSSSTAGRWPIHRVRRWVTMPSKAEGRRRIVTYDPLAAILIGGTEQCSKCSTNDRAVTIIPTPLLFVHGAGTLPGAGKHASWIFSHTKGFALQQ